MRHSLFTLVGLGACASGDAGLEALHADIVSDYPTVTHQSAMQVDTLGGDLILLDIREVEEFAVSHLPGAIRIDPGIETNELLSRLPDLNGKTVIVYCSVGRRSSAFAYRMQTTLLQDGALSVSNLQNGIFGWHGEDRPLTDAEGSTDVVHPYDAFWARYVPRREQVRYVPD